MNEAGRRRSRSKPVAFALAINEHGGALLSLRTLPVHQPIDRAVQRRRGSGSDGELSDGQRPRPGEAFGGVFWI